VNDSASLTLSALRAAPVLPREFFNRDPVTIARELLGKLLIRRVGRKLLAGRVVEDEAYLGANDPAAHAYTGRTARNAVLFGPPGHAYVYFIYGMYFCMNVVTEPAGKAAAVLLRALEPVKNVERACGPGLLCRALRIDRHLNGHDLLSDDLFLAEPEENAPVSIVKRPRVGVDYAGRWARRHLRFYIKGNPCISRP